MFVQCLFIKNCFHLKKYRHKTHFLSAERKTVKVSRRAVNVLFIYNENSYQRHSWLQMMTCGITTFTLTRKANSYPSEQLRPLHPRRAKKYHWQPRLSPSPGKARVSSSVGAFRELVITSCSLFCPTLKSFFFPPDFTTVKARISRFSLTIQIFFSKAEEPNLGACVPMTSVGIQAVASRPPSK